MLLRFNQAACLLPALTGLLTKYSLSLPCSKPYLANVICQVNQGEWALRWLLYSLAALPWRQAAKQAFYLPCFTLQRFGMGNQYFICRQPTNLLRT